ncbi:MAG: methyltransferase domain-containing protein [Magnetococcales bacterium]|nr:methyltransferase domain-containing protein [Magnetococcales bacterium]
MLTLDTLLSMIRGHQPAQAILTAHRLGIFRHLGERSLTAGEIAAGLDLAGRGVTILLDALTALQVIEKRGDHYRNAETALRHLSGSGPEDRGVSLDHYADLMRVWMRLEESVRSGRSCRRPEEHLTQGDAQRNAVFIGAMAEIGRPHARTLAGAIPLDGHRTLLDLGGGPGVYAEEFLRRNPALHAVIGDLESTLCSARPLVAMGEFADRISFRALDAYGDAQLAGGFDAVLVSNVLHMEGVAENQALLRKIHAAMDPGGRIILHEKVIEPDRAAPVDAALFAINMLVNTERGNCYTRDEMAGWLEQAGFSAIEEVNCFANPSVLVARKAMADQGNGAGQA